jgi:hypothetical protein
MLGGWGEPLMGWIAERLLYLTRMEKNEREWRECREDGVMG